MESGTGMRIIGHLDMDAFFAAVEERDRPAVKGLPVVVGADPREGRGRGVVSTASYKARAYGIHSAMPISIAWRLSEDAWRRGKPPVVFLPPDFDRYLKSSSRVEAIVRARVPVIEKAGIDEMYIDLGFTETFEKAAGLATALKDDIRSRERLTASVGIGPNKLVAKIASDRRKPDGLTVVLPEEAEAFLEPLSVRVIPGIGPKTEARLAERRVRTIRDLKSLPRPVMEELFGKWGLDIYERARGLDDSPLETGWIPKSIGEQETFQEDTLDLDLLLGRAEAMSKSVFERFKEEGFKTFRTVTVTVRFRSFVTKTRSHTFPEPTDSLDALKLAAFKLLLPFIERTGPRTENPDGLLIRLIGVRVEKLGGLAGHEEEEGDSGGGEGSDDGQPLLPMD